MGPTPALFIIYSPFHNYFIDNISRRKFLIIPKTIYFYNYLEKIKDI